jgi:hypothetical protein
MVVGLYNRNTRYSYGTNISSRLNLLTTQIAMNFQITFSDINLKERVYKADKKSNIFIMFVNSNVLLGIILHDHN